MVKKAATKEENERMAKIAQMQCCVANGDCRPGTQVHHITKTGRRLGHMFTIPLCENHHSPQTPLPYGEAVHNGVKTFESQFGTQMEMLERTNAMINIGEG